MALVTTTLRDGIAVLTIDHPPVNSFGHALRTRFVSELEQALGDAEVETVLIAAAGRLFSAGADIREFGTPAMTARPHLRDICELLDGAGKPVAIAIQGSAAGGAVELALTCHYRIAHQDARLALPEVLLGIVPGSGGTQRLPRLVGIASAIEIITTGKQVHAGEAEDIGLVDEVVAGDLLDGALAFLRQGPHAVRRTSELTDRLAVEKDSADALFVAARETVKRRASHLLAPAACIDCIEAAIAQPFAEGLETERRIFDQCLASDQSAALRHAFFAERAVSRVDDLPPDTQPRAIQRAGVVGCGTMGQGIAINFAAEGIPVTVLEMSDEASAAGHSAIEQRFAKRVARGRMSQQQMDDTMSVISRTTNYDEFASADIVVEAVFEEMDIKQDVFRALDEACPPGCILATNTSTLDVDAIAAVTNRPDLVVGTHFFSPADVMKLMENVRGARTSSETIATVMALSKRLNKVGVLVGVCDGFVGNRMLFPYFRETDFLLEEGAMPQQVDRAMTEFGFAMGPFAVGDLAGLDVGWRIRKRQAPTRDPALRYSPVADRVCELGRFGQKTGAGWYRYDPGDRRPIPDPEIEQLIRDTANELGIEQREITDEEIVERSMFPLINEGARILEEGIAQRPGDIDVIWLYGYGFPRHRGGPMFYADQVGLDRVYERMCAFEAEHGAHMRPADLLKTLATSGRGFADA